MLLGVEPLINYNYFLQVFCRHNLPAGRQNFDKEDGGYRQIMEKILYRSGLGLLGGLVVRSLYDSM